MFRLGHRLARRAQGRTIPVRITCPPTVVRRDAMKDQVWRVRVEFEMGVFENALLYVAPTAHTQRWHVRLVCAFGASVPDHHSR